MTDTNRPKSLSLWFAVAQVTGLATVAMLIAWVFEYAGGVAWTYNPAQQFYWHVIFTVIAFGYLNGTGLLLYRVFPHTDTRTLRIVHVVIQVVAFALAVIALVAVFDSHDLQGLDNLYSLHGFIGMTAVVLLGIQMVAGVFVFLLPIVPDSVRSSYLPFHKSGAMMLQMASTVAVVAGITEKSYGSMTDNSSEHLLVNGAGLMLVIFSGIVQYILINPDFKRPKDTMLKHEPLE